MSLLEEHKAERRTRIMAAARKLVVTKGYEGLTMRDLARAARVSVPTLYNLFGSKDAILVAELEASAARVAARMIAGNSFFTRGMAAFEAGMQLIEDAPEFHRAVMQMAMTSPETAPMRRRAEEGYIAIMAGNLAAAKQAGQLASWAEPMIVARHILIGVARGEFAEEVEANLRNLSREPALQQFTEVRHVASRTHD